MSQPGNGAIPLDQLLRDLDEATGHLLTVAGTLDDAACRGPSRLPGWTRGHVLSHLARNADGLANLVTWAVTGSRTPMYASAEARSADIDAGAGRSAAEHLADLRVSAAGFRAAVAQMPRTAMEVEVAMLSGAEAYGWEIPVLRVREIEVHLVDLDHGVAATDWSERFSRSTLDQLSPGIVARGESPVGCLEAPDGSRWPLGAGADGLLGPPQALLGWLMGRADGSDLLPQRRDDVPSPPRWG